MAVLIEDFHQVVGSDLVLCSAFDSNVYKPFIFSSNADRYASYGHDFDFISKQVLTINQLWTKEDAFGGRYHTLGLPIRWLSRAQFGVLLLITEHKTNPQEKLFLLESLVSHIEKDLVAIYQKHQARFHDEFTHLIHCFPAPEFQSFIDSFQDHIWIKDLTGRYTHCNKEVEKAWSKKLSEIVGKKDNELFDPELAEKFVNADKEVILAGRQVVVEECANGVNPNNKTWLETIKTPLVDTTGSLIGIIGMTRNVTNRKAIEDQLVIASTVFENSIEGVIITNRDGMIIYVNKAFSEITGYEPAEAIGRNPRFLKSGRHGKDFYREMWQELVSKGKWKGELWNRRKDGSVYPELSTISAVYDVQEDITSYVAVFNDISQQKQQEQDLLHMAYHDPLTDLPNRSKLTNKMEQEIVHAARHKEQFATIFIDVDHFKHINDSFGHLVGDEVLCEVAKRLSSRVRAEDTVSRIGGDEFVVLLPGIQDIDSVNTVVRKLMSVFEKPIVLSEPESIRLTGSMGIALFPEDGEDSDTLLSNADAAMYRAKQTGRNNFAYYTEALTKESEAHLKLQAAMHNALDNDQFHLEYQPQIDMLTGKLIGLESLIRWVDPKMGNIPPIDFIPLAEKTGLIQEIGLWVLRKACQQGVEWLSQGYSFGRIAVNVAGPQLQRETFVDQVIEILHETGLDARYLELEVTEGFMMNNAKAAIQYLHKIREAGIELSMDDFGTGYSSLSYLQQLPLNKIKIDRSFVMNLPNNSHDIAIADAVIALGNALSLKVIAEGVETGEQAEFLMHRGCHQAQGYYFSKPQRPENLVHWLEQSKVVNK